MKSTLMSWASTMVAMASLAGLTSCSKLGTVLLYNGSGHPITVTSRDDTYQLATGEIKDVRIEPLYGNHVFQIQPMQGGMACFVMVKVPGDWIRAGSHARAMAMVDERGQIYLYSPKSDPATFYKSPPPDQPANFPLKPKESPEACVPRAT